MIAAPTACPCCGSAQAVEARRGRDRDAGGDPAPLEGDPDGARALQLPRLRADHAAAGALPRHAARLRRPAAPGHDPVREVRPASAAEPAERALRPGRDRAQRLDARRPGRRLHDGAAPAPRADRGARAGGRAAARRRHHRADPGQGQDDHRAGSGPTSATTGRSAARTRRRRSSTPRATGRPASRASPGGFARHPAGRRLWRLQRALRARSRAAGAGHAGLLLGACPAQVLRAGRHRRQRPARQERRR